MKPEEDILIRAQRLLAESAALGRQCAAFYERQDQAEPPPSESSPNLLSQHPPFKSGEFMNEQERALIESLNCYQALVERADALRLAIEARQAKIAAVEALQMKWGWKGPGQDKWHDR